MKGRILAVLFLWAPALFGQSAPPTQINASNDTGLSPHIPYSTGVGDVNLTNGNLTLEIPLVNLRGRVGNALNMTIQYDSKIWVPHYVVSGDGSTIVYTWQTERRSSQTGDMGWRLNDEDMTPGGWETDSNGNQTGNLPDIITLKDGSKHSIGENRFCCGQALDSEDASSLGIDPYSSDFSVRTKNGDSKHFGSSNDVDSNGNQYAPTDTLGRVITVTNNPGYGNYPGTIQYVDSNGVTRTITLNYTVLTLFSSDPASPYYVPGPRYFAKPVQGHSLDFWTWVAQPSANSQRILLTGITLPDSTQYTFSYNGYGELARLSFPTGGYASYTYSAFTHDENYWWGPSQIVAADFREVTSRQVCDGAGLCGTTTYTPAVSAGYVNNTTMDVVEASGTTNAHLTHSTFSQASVAGEVCDKFYSPRETSRLVYAGAANTTQLLRTISTSYNSYTGGACGDLYLPTVITTTLNDAGPTPPVKKEEFDYDTYTAHVFYPFSVDPSVQTAQDVSVPIDNVIAHREYAYGSGSPGPLIRTTQTDWLKTSAYTVRSNHVLNRKTRIAILDSSGIKKSETKYEYDNYTEGLNASGAVRHQSVGTARGNLTAIDNWLNTTNTYLETRFQYDDAGNGRKAADPLSHTTNMSYADSWGNNACAPSGGSAAAYLTGITDALNHVTSATYNSCSGSTASITDPNNQVASYSYDLMGRPTHTGFPDGGAVDNTYSTSSVPFSVTATKKLDASRNVVSQLFVDGLARVFKTLLCEDGTSCAQTIRTDTTYDPVGRTATISNPYRLTSDSTYGISTTNYDALNRVTKLIPPDGSTSSNNVTTTYSGNCTTVADQAGKSRKSCTDALGRLTQIFEDPAGLNYETDYTYDALNNLLTVNQKGNDPNSANWRTRTFTYNSLSQLLTASNPESGTITYTYDNDGNVATKVAPAPNQTASATVTTTYSYDALNRLTQKSYSDGLTPTPYYHYDMAMPWGSPYGGSYVGRLSEEDVFDASGHYVASHIFVYDAMGRIQETGQCTAVDCSVPGVPGFHTIYSHDLMGNLTSYYTAENGTTFGYQYDSAGRASVVTNSSVDPQHPATLATVDSTLGYFPSGALRKIAYGNGLTETAAFNNRLQPCRYNVNSSSAALSACADAIPSGSVQDFNYGFGTANNGNVASWSATGNQSFTRTFGYDPLNRLSTFGDSASAQPCKGLSWTYDAWGNRTDQTVTAGTCNTFHAGVAPNNRLVSPYQYDAAGNMTYDGFHYYTYDAENRITQVDGGSTATYAYDADGNRVQKTVGSVITVYVFNPSGQVIHETDANINFNVHYIHLGGQLIAEMKNSTTYFVHPDHLGSTRLLTAMDESVFDNMDYLPFGEQIAGSSGSTHKFTGKERDSESGLDNFGARYYSSSLGRFAIPDWSAKPVSVPYADYADPQSLNLYSYVRNSPTARTDADGHCPTCGIAIVSWIIKGTARDGSTKEFAKNNAAGSAKSAGSFAYHAVMASNPITMMVDHYKGEPNALKASNQTQAEAKTVTTIALTVASFFLPGPKGGGLSDSALVVRGGVPSAENIARSAESIAANGTVQGVSVQSANGAAVGELSANLPQTQIGVTTVGDVRAAGGDVVQTPLDGSPNHCDLCGVTPQQASDLLAPMRNPNKPPKPLKPDQN